MAMHRLSSCTLTVSDEFLEVDADAGVALLKQSIDAATAVGFTWNVEPIRLTPQPRLVELVALSRAKALAGESEGENASGRRCSR